MNKSYLYLAISVRTAIPIIMGTNIGSTITSTLVAFTQIVIA